VTSPKTRSQASEQFTWSLLYDYSGDDLRTSRTESGVTESYLWDRLSALPTIVDDGTTQSVHGPSGSTTEITKSSASYALPDALGSVRSWVGSGGSAVGTTDWDVWGNKRSTTGVVGMHGFAGERTDPTSGLVYLRARDYSPGTARFVQPDPLQPNAVGTHGYNPYWYANNNPGTVRGPVGVISGVGERVGLNVNRAEGMASKVCSMRSQVTSADPE
jgi:RHS repeat-associated protein